MNVEKKFKKIAQFYFVILTFFDFAFLCWLFISDVNLSTLRKFTIIIVPYLILISLVHLYQKNIKILMRRISERERSIDDMLNLVEVKCDEARALAKNKSEFLSNMSHEIRTPINAVLGMNEMILRECDNDVIFNYAYHVKNSGNMLLSLVNDILDFSKIESGKMELVYGNYQISSVINDLVNMTNSKLRDKDLQLVLEIDEKLPCEVYGDDIRLKQIMVNLLSNAVKYTPKGKITLRITGEQKDNFFAFRFEVEDTGIGLKPEDLAKLSQKFLRFDQRKNKNIEGTGLGLNITNRLLELMGSKLQVNSVYEKGSVFYFELEQKIIDFTPIGKFEYRFDDHEACEKYEASFTAPEACVLVVDDNEMNRNVFRALLKDIQVQIDEAQSGMECLEKIHEKKYHIIFMDHMMPEMDGVETYNRIKESNHHFNADTPVIILTANAVAGAKEKYLEIGFDDFLSKPIVPDKLEKVIKDFLPTEFIKPGAPKKKMEAKIQIDELPAVEGLDWNYAAIHFLDKETLDEAVNSFYRSITSERNKLSESFEQIKNNPENEDIISLYRIKVHAMKSAANIIGLVPLSGFAAMLEYAARDNDIQMILDATPHFLNNWEKYKEKLKPCVPEEQKEAIEDLDDIKDAFRELIVAVESFDIDSSDQIMAYLRRKDFGSDTQILIDELEAAVVNLEDENVKLLVNKILVNMER